MVFLSNHEDMILGENYTRGMVSDMLNLKYSKDEIERSIFKPRNHSSVLLFVTIQNQWGNYYAKISDNELVSNDLYNDKLESFQKDNEILLFIRDTYDSGFYYLGKCQPTRTYKDQKGYHYYGLKLLEFSFSKLKRTTVPGVNRILQ